MYGRVSEMNRISDQKTFFEAFPSLWKGGMLALVLFISAGNIRCGLEILGLGWGLIDNLTTLIIGGLAFCLSVSLVFLVCISNWKFWKVGFLEPIYSLFFVLMVFGVVLGFLDQHLVFLFSFVIAFVGFYININNRIDYFIGDYSFDIIGASMTLWVGDKMRTCPAV